MTTSGDFDVRVEELPDGAVVMHVHGDLDLATAPELERELAERTADARLVIDLTPCSFLDSSGVRVLAAAAGDAERRGGQLGLVVVDPGIARVLEITGIDSLTAVHSSLEAAL